ncbi:MAG TPA: flagellar hook-length control protein FliK [Bacteroidota bacterium]|nr:flagellar hook-length control protein FliK [Bacteroidota bacterium]
MTGRPVNAEVVPSVKGDDTKTDEERSGIALQGQIALIGSFAPAVVSPVALPNGGPDSSPESDDTATESASSGGQAAPLSAAPDGMAGDTGDVVATLLKNSVPLQQAATPVTGQPQGDSGAPPIGESVNQDGTPAVAPDARPDRAPQATLNAQPGTDAEEMLALALGAVADALSQGAPASADSHKSVSALNPLKPGSPQGELKPVVQQAQQPEQPQQDVEKALQAPARIAEVPVPDVRGDSPAQYPAPAGRVSRAHGGGENDGGEEETVSQSAPVVVADGDPAVARTFSVPAKVFTAGDAPAQSPAPQPVPAKSEEGDAPAPAPLKQAAGDTPRVQQPAPENAPAGSQSSASRSAGQTIVPSVDITGRPEPAQQAAPKQEIPAAYAPLPQEVSRHIADQVVRNLSLQLDGNASEMRMTLKPPSLGEVQLHVRVEDSKMAAQIDVSQQLVKSALEAHMPQLRQALQEHGIEVQRIDVMVPEQSAHQGGTGSGGERTGRRGGRRAAASGDDEPLQAVKDMGYNTIELIM